jgi:predicted esterase
MKFSLFRYTSFGFVSLLCRPFVSVAFVLAYKKDTLKQSCSNPQLQLASVMEGSSSSPEIIRVLALHGSEGNAQEFPNRLKALNDVLAGKNMQLEITAVQGPFEKGPGYCWWTMPPSVRSFNAKEYVGFEESATIVLDAWNNDDFDLVFGHSQGAILVAALLALKRAPYHPKRGYIMNGVSFPNPYSDNFVALKVEDSTHPPNILFILGRKDTTTPNSSGEQLRDGFAKAGFQVASCYHDGGHGIPQQDDSKSLSNVAMWIQNQKISSSKL